VNEHLRPEDAAQALTEIRQRQQQVIDLAVLPTWYWWAIGALTVILAAGVDTNTPAAVGTTVAVFVLGILAATGWALAGTLRHAQLRDGLVDRRGSPPSSALWPSPSASPSGSPLPCGPPACPTRRPWPRWSAA
jgi:hypothetical protein